jgi:hypothetical protein
MKRSSLTVTYVLVLLTIFMLSGQAFARPFDWHYSRFATPFAIFCNPALLGSNPGTTVGFDTRYADTTDYDARLAVTTPLSKVLKREEHQREIAGSNRKYGYAYPSYMSSEMSISFGGIYAGGDNYNLDIGFAAPIRMVQTGVSLCLAHKNKDNIIGLMNLGLSANVMSSGIVYLIINNINIYNFTNVTVSGNNSSTDFGLSIGTSGSPFTDTNKVFLPYDILFTYTPKGDVITVGALAGMVRLNLDLTHIYTSRDITGQTAVASIGYNFLRDEYGRVSHSIFASLGLEFVNKASSAALAGGYGVRSKRSDEVHGAFMYSVVNKTGVGNDNDLVSRIYCSAVDSNRVIFGLYTGGADINSWVMRIETHGGDNIKTFSGGNVIPASIIWDGLSSEGNKLEDDIVYVKLAVRGKNKVVESEMVSVEIVGGKPKPKKDL